MSLGTSMRRLGGAGVVIASLLLPLWAASAGASSPAAAPVTANGAAQEAGSAERGDARILVLYDTQGPEKDSDELNAIMTSNLVSRFGYWQAEPVSEYQPGQLNDFDAVVYQGSNATEPIPDAFLDEVLLTDKPVMWIGLNVDRLVQRQQQASGVAFADTRGWSYEALEYSDVTSVRYKDVEFSRDIRNAAVPGVPNVIEPDQVEVLAIAGRQSGSTFPWALRSGNLTYVVEIPYGFTSENDRYVAFTGLLFDVLPARKGSSTPGVPERHRALLRLEDVSPKANSKSLRKIADLLEQDGVPFGINVIPAYLDPNGARSADGQPETLLITDDEAKEFRETLKYMVARGGVIMMHGYTHQYEARATPYNGVTGDDFEFFLASVAPNDNVVLEGAVPQDSRAWARGRLDAGLALFEEAGLPRPQIFTTPHYAASPEAYRAIGDRFKARFEESLYFPGLLSGEDVDTTVWSSQFFTYPVTDVYGSLVIPENLRNEVPVGYNNNPPRTPNDILDSAMRNLVVQDGFGSVFWHPYLADLPEVGLDSLRTIVEGMQAEGYDFISPLKLLSNAVISPAPSYSIPPSTSRFAWLGLMPAAVITISMAYAAMLVVVSRRRPDGTVRPMDETLFVFMVPCLDEELVIRGTIGRLLGLAGASSAVLVIDDGSEDNTAAIARSFDPRRVWLLQRTLPEARQGKGAALNAGYHFLMESGVLASRRPDDVVVVVVDADGQLEPSALVEVAPSFRNPQMGAVQIGVRMRNADTNTLTRMQDMEFVVYTELFQRARHQIGSAGLGGNGQFVRLTALESLGDDPWSDYLTEDLDLGLRILAAGWETAFCPRTHVDQQAVTTLPKLIRQRTRWYQGHLQCWSRIPSLVRSSLRMRVVTDLMFHLLIALAVLLTGLLSITFVAALTVYTITNPSDAFDFATSGSSWRLGLWYVASFGLCWIYAYVYWLVTPKRSFLRVLATAHLFLMYTYIWVAAGVWALWRIAARKTSWAKTSRIQEHGDEDVDESDVPSNVVVPFDRSDAARS